MKKHVWSQTENQYLIKHYPNVRTDLIANALGLLLAQVYGRAKRLGLKKSKAFLDSKESGRLMGQHGKNTRFEPGHTSWNKGKKFNAGGRSLETQFKSGAMPHNHKPIGSYRINGDGYLDLKVSNAKGANHVRWHPVHRLIWERAYGPVPKGSLIVFKPGMKTNKLEELTLDKVECITRAEHARRHNPNSRGPEFGHLVRLKGAITRHVNRITREHNEAAQ